MTSDLLTVVIPYHSQRALLERALSHLAGWSVLVVDDSEAGLDLDVARIRLGGSGGFARAANAGLAAVRTPWAVLLNDDAYPIEDCIDRLSHAGGLCGPLLVGPNGVESAGLSVRGWGRVVQVTRVPGVDGPVDALSGCCLHLPASARFNPAFRHGYEDVELCRRVGPALGGARLMAHARCWHEGGASLDRRSGEAQRHAVSGQLRLVEPGWRDAVVAGLALAQIAREARSVAEVRDRAPAVVAGWRDARRG
ncbi:MAG: hypothetical protein EXR69_02960 [Myxococcales bacterium]|nr:hypothetical protein [Myxococcales bacterium]